MDSKTGIEQPILIAIVLLMCGVAVQQLVLIQSDFSIVPSIVYFVAAPIPVYLTFSLKKYNTRGKHLQNLTLILAGFLIMQGIYHFVGAIGLNSLAKGVLEPLSFGILLLFGFIYLFNSSRNKREEIKEA